MSKPLSPAPQASTQAPITAADFARLSHEFLEAYWQLEPEYAVAMGRFDLAAKASVPDAAQRQREARFAQHWLARLQRLNASALPAAAQTDLGQILNTLRYQLFGLNELRQWSWDPSAYNIASTLDLLLNTDYAPLEQRLVDISQRLARTPAYYQAARAALQQPTQVHTELALEQVPGVLSVLDEVGRQAATSTLSPAQRHTLAQRISAAREAVTAYGKHLQALLPQLGGEHARSFRLGAALYEPKFAFSIQSALSAEQTYRNALAERERLYTQMEQLADQLWSTTMGLSAKPKDRIEKIARIIDQLSSQHVRREDFVSAIRAQIPELERWVAQKDLLSQDASKPLVVRETPVYQRGVAGAGIEAPGPYRPQGNTYYNVTPLDDLTDAEAQSTLREYNHWILQILNIHEAVPGHYTQLVHANKSPSLIKSIFGNDAMVEGWAVYSERMMLESGYGGNAPEMWLMWCKWNLRAVTNTILDYSVHVLGMEREAALDLLQRQAFQTEREATEKWRRVQLTSVQLTSYYSGYADIMALRQARQDALGSGFKLKDFHEEFLSHGSAPVATIRRLMQR
ncbi:DUF885 domain-containing protein [Roseateles sp. BYS180W]|uniref:DUF885 domain-containing protein n=2 Tax=Roseateles rivi TaxID=3299028 RepID=A0ABW7FSS3_9BURK